MDAHAVPAGWYEDPSDDALIRYWDGTVWTAQTGPRQPAPAPAPVAPTPVAPAPVAPTHVTPAPPVAPGPPVPLAPGNAAWSTHPSSSVPPAAGNAPWSTHPSSSSVPQAPGNAPWGTHPSPYFFPPQAQYAPYAPYPPASSRAGRTLLIGGVYTVVVVVLLLVVGAVVLVRQGGIEAAGSPPSCGPGGAGVAGAIPAELSTTAKAGRPVITPDGARAVVETFWPLREQAMQSCDLATLAELDTGSARIGDVAKAACGCVRPANAPILDAAYYVSRQTTFPAYFMAEVRTVERDDMSWAEIMVFTRTSRKAHWQLTFATGSGLDQGRIIGIGTPAVDAAGYVKLPDRRTKKAAAAAAKELAALWQESKDTGTVPPSRFGDTDWTTVTPREIAEHPQDTVQRNGLRGHFSYRVLPDTPMFHAPSADSDLACTVIQVRSTYTGAEPGDHPQQSRDRMNWGSELAPGSYRSITTDAVSETCFVIPFDGARQAQVIGGDYVNESISSGVPLSR